MGWDFFGGRGDGGEWGKLNIYVTSSPKVGNSSCRKLTVSNGGPSCFSPLVELFW